MSDKKTFNLKNSYAKELHEISEKCIPTGFRQAEFLLKNYDLAEKLGFTKNFLDSKECLNIFSGNSLLKNSQPIAQGYSGHQFGHFNPQLGDGRAILLGEIDEMDIQLKGIGQTPYSRRGDGKSALGPVLKRKSKNCQKPWIYRKRNLQECIICNSQKIPYKMT